MNKKVIATTIAATIAALSITAASAMAADKPVRVNFDNSEISEDGVRMRGHMQEAFGIKLELEGLSEEEIKEKMASRREQMETDMQGKKTEMLEQLKAALIEKGVDVDGLDEKGLFEAAKENDLLQGLEMRKIDENSDMPIFRMRMDSPEGLAKALGIDLEGMTDEQKADAISQAVKNWCLERFSEQANAPASEPAA